MMDLKPIYKGVLNGAEDFVKKEIEEQADKVVSDLLTKLEELIPGKLDDVVIEQVKPKLLPEVKKALLALADKIDGEVG